MRYVALLRGINVGGITIRMAELKDVFTGLGYGNVKTVLASGNVLFDSDSRPAELKAAIETALSARFGYEAFVFVLDQATIGAVADTYPFEEDRDGRHAYAVFVADPAVLDELAATAEALDPTVERIVRGDGVLYWEVERDRTVTSAFGKNTGKPRYKAVTTTRNLRTLRKLQA